MKTKLKISRTVLAFICLFLALGITFGLSPFLQRVSSGRVKIVRVASDIEAGALIPDSALETVSVGSYNLPENVVYKKADAKGKYARTAMMKGDMVLVTKLSSTPPIVDAYLTDIPDGEQAISISVKSFAGGLSGKLLPGDIVTTIALDDNKKAITPVELRYLYVLAATSSDGTDKLSTSQPASPKEEEKPQPVSTVTLLVCDRQAKRLAEMEASNWTHISLVSRGNQSKATKLLTEQRKVIDGMPEAVVETMDTFTADSRQNDSVPTDAGYKNGSVTQP